MRDPAQPLLACIIPLGDACRGPPYRSVRVLAYARGRRVGYELAMFIVRDREWHAVVDKATVRQLRRLLERRRRLDAQCEDAINALALATFEASEQGASRLDVARALGVGTSTVQGWVNRGRQLTAR